MSDKEKNEAVDSREDTDDNNEENADGKENGEDRNEDQDENNNGGVGSKGDIVKIARTPTNPALISRLQHRKSYRQARGLGAGGTGAATWRVQRLTALALIPLTLWFAVSVVRLSMGSRTTAAHWLAHPLNAAVMAVFIVIALRHAVIGLQIILEDYVEGEGLRTVAVLTVKAAALVLGVAAVAALIHLSL